MRRQRVSRTSEEWKRIVDGWQRGKQSQRAYCVERGIGLSSFIRWRQLFKRKPSRQQRGEAFVAVGPLNLAAGQPAAVLRFPDGAKVELSRVPDPEWVRKVLES
jgi:hypothetical protein